MERKENGLKQEEKHQERLFEEQGKIQASAIRLDTV